MMLKRFREKYFDDDLGIRMKLCRMMLLLGTVGMFINFLAIIFIMRQSFNFYIMSLIGSVTLFIIFLLSHRFKYGKNILFLSLILLNLILLPYSFFTSGGAESGTPIWMMMGLILVFIFLDGWRHWIVFAFSVAADILLFYIGAKNPEAVAKLSSRAAARQDMAISLIINGIIIGLLFTYMNHLYIKERKLAEQRAKEIEEMSNSKSLFFANMSHEIRTPINTILGLNEMILREDISDEVAENAVNIQNASKLLLSLINDILDVSKMESGKMELVNARYETADMLSEIVNMIWVRANQKNLDFKIDIDENVPSALIGDEGRLKQVIVNILTNAVKYTEKGSVIMSVKSEASVDGRINLKISVTDTGIGIKRENLNELFDVFKRLDIDPNRRIEGTGLGLAISKQLVEMMNGSITVDSIYQKGSCFTVTVEQEVADISPVGTVQYMIKNDIRNRQVYKQSFEAPEADVLIVDDNEMNLMVAKKLLRDTKIRVDTALSGKECLEKTRRKYYHVILMDHMMPEMDGEETLMKVRGRGDGYCQRTPVIAITANAMSNASEYYREKGFNGYLAKPINAGQLEAMLQKFLPPELIEYAVDTTDTDVDDPEFPMLFHSRKKKICISTDCICDLPDEWVKHFDIRLMYYYVTTENGRFMDMKELCSEELLGYISSGGEAVSSCASVEEYEAFFADNLIEAERVIHISTASGVGNGYEMASRAAEGFDNVIVIDSGMLSSGLGIVVMHAAQKVQDGAEFEEIIASVNNMRERVSTSFIVPNAESMYHNGRVSKKLKNVCDFFNIHPILRMKKSRIVFGGFKLGSMETADLKYVRKALKKPHKLDERLLFITYAGCSVEQIEKIKAEAERLKKFEHVIVCKASSAISCNCGTGCFGLICIRD